MKKLIRLHCLALTAFTFSTLPATAETLEDVKKKIHAKVSSYKSLHYKVKTTADMTTAGVSIQSKIEMTLDYQKQGNKLMSRTEQTSETEQDFGGQKMKMKSHTLTVEDGEFSYSYTNTNGQKAAVKQKLDPKTRMSPFDAMTGFKIMEETFVVKLLPEATIEGKPTYVLEASPKDEAMKAHMGKTVSYYDKKTGIAIKTVSYDPKGKVINTATTSDIQINKPIKSDLFVFKAPEGVQMIDMTGSGAASP